MANLRILGYVPRNRDGEPQTGEQSRNQRTKLLRLKVVAGHNLAKKDIFGASDPYVRVDLMSISNDEIIDTVNTKTKKKTLNPKWDEEFVFQVKPSEHKLLLEVFDENRVTRDDFLGMVELPLHNLSTEQNGRVIPHTYYILRPRSARSRVRGHLQLYHAYLPSDNNTITNENSENNEQNTQENEPGWEVVDMESHPAQEETPAQPLFLPPSTDVTSALPPGWEERQDANGRTYLVNHITRTTQWDRPTGLGTLLSEPQSACRRRCPGDLAFGAAESLPSSASPEPMLRGRRVLTVEEKAEVVV